MGPVLGTRPVEVAARGAVRAELAPPHSAEPREWTGWFDSLYREADGDPSRIP